MYFLDSSGIIVSNTAVLFVTLPISISCSGEESKIASKGPELINQAVCYLVRIPPWNGIEQEHLEYLMIFKGPLSPLR